MAEDLRVLHGSEGSGLPRDKRPDFSAETMMLQLYSKKLLCLALFALLALPGCVDKQEKPRLIFDTGTLKQAEWKQVDKTCEYEVAKAVAPIKIGIIATEQYRKLYILCAESKGASFIGSTDVVKTSGPKIVATQPYYWN